MRLIKATLRFLILAFLAVASVFPHNVGAQSSNELVMTASAGFDGSYKQNSWLPVYVTLENQGSDVTGYIEARWIDAGGDQVAYRYNLDLPSVSRKTITLYVFGENYATQLEVSYVSQGKMLVKSDLQLKSLNTTDLLFGVVAARPSAFNVFSQLDPPNGTAAVAALEIQELPTQGQAMVSLDVLVISGVDSGLLAPDQRTALADWVAWGGKLILTGGTDWQKTSAGLTGSEMAGLIPFTLEGSQSLPEANTQAVMTAIQAFAGSQETLVAGDTALVLATGTPAAEAETLLRSSTSQAEGLPLLLYRHYGAGEVYYLAFDPSQDPLRTWNGAADFYRTMLRTSRAQPPAWAGGFKDWTLAREAAMNLPNINLPPTLLICGFLLIYLIILGPVNFLFLRRLKRRELGWITIPALVVVFSLAVFLAGSLSHGNRPILNRLSIVQVWPGLPRARVDGALGIYSPGRSTYQAQTEQYQFLHYLPSPTGLGSNRYQVWQEAGNFSIPNLHIDVSGVAPFALVGSLPAPQFTHDLAILIDANGATLRGNISNHSDLDLKNIVLLTTTGPVQIGALQPGETFEVHHPLNKAQVSMPSTLAIYKTAPGISIAPPSYVQPFVDTTISDLLGTTNYYNDKETYRKFSLLTAAVGYTSDRTVRGTGIYLAGWSDQPVLQAGLVGKTANTLDETLYIIALQPTTQLVGNILRLTPGLYTWHSLEQNGIEASPYNMSLYSPAIYALEFSPLQQISFSKVRSLTLHLSGPGKTGPVSEFKASIYNYQEDRWDGIEGLIWGDNVIAEPEAYVTPGGGLILGDTTLPPGTIRLRVEAGAQSTEITSSDFTLEVDR